MTIKSCPVGSGTNKHTRYIIKDGDSEVCWFDDLKTTGIVARFLKGSRLDNTDYEIAKTALDEWDMLHSLPKGESLNGIDGEQAAGNPSPADMSE